MTTPAPAPPLSAGHPEKQGLKRNMPDFIAYGNVLSAGHPEKQGLKLRHARAGHGSGFALSGSSRKTRIETPPAARGRCMWPQLSAGHPEKQGLKQHGVQRVRHFVDLSAGHPEKQGLKPSARCRPKSVRPRTLSGSSRKTRIETAAKVFQLSQVRALSAGHPEKQGLKPY